MLRPKSFLEHNNHFVISIADPPTATTSRTPSVRPLQHPYTCWQVPRHLQGKPWMHLLTQYWPSLEERLVLPEPASHVLNVLSKFEDPRFIHAFSLHAGTKGTYPAVSTGNGTSARDEILILWHLPRFNLRLVMRFVDQTLILT